MDGNNDRGITAQHNTQSSHSQSPETYQNPLTKTHGTVTLWMHSWQVRIRLDLGASSHRGTSLQVWSRAVHFKKAPDGASRIALGDHGSWIIGLHTGTESVVKCGGALSIFAVNSEVRQDCVFAPLLFNTYMGWSRVIIQSHYRETAILKSPILTLLTMMLSCPSLWKLYSSSGFV